MAKIARRDSAICKKPTYIGKHKQADIRHHLRHKIDSSSHYCLNNVRTTTVTDIMISVPRS